MVEQNNEKLSDKGFVRLALAYIFGVLYQTSLFDKENKNQSKDAFNILALFNYGYLRQTDP